MSKVIKLSEKVKPLFTDILVSLIVEVQESKAGIILMESTKKSMISDVQKVMACGVNVTQVGVGDQVKLKMENLLIIESNMVNGKTSSEHDKVEDKKFVINPQRIHSIDGVDYLMIREGDIAYKVLDSNI